MVSKLLFGPCTVHENCTMKMGFVPLGEVGYDMVTDLKPVPEPYQANADKVFGTVYCVEVEHIDGKMNIEVAQ